MSLFDSIINEAESRFGLGNKAGNLLAALLGLLTDQKQGGFTGFLDRFSEAGLGDTVTSWISTGANSDLSEEQLESALGGATLTNLANQADVNASTAKSALAYMVPQVVDQLTPDGEIPDETSLLSRLGGYLTGGAAALGTAGAALGTEGVGTGAFDRVDAAAGSTVDPVVADKTVSTPAFDRVSAGESALEAERHGSPVIGDRVGNSLAPVGDDIDGDGGILRWLLPLILLGLLLLLGYWFCGKSNVPVMTNTNANAAVNANKPVNMSGSPVVNANANMNSNMNSNMNANMNANTGAARALTEVTLPDGTKLQAYPGGIEDQLVKFIESDAYKSGTADTLKDKWFNFDDLNFKFGTAELEPSSKRQLDNIVSILKAFPEAKVKIGGYTDKKGDDAANLKLSDTRAKAVKAAMEKAGVGAQVPEAEGYGEKFATVAETASDAERGVDRKTAIRLLK